MAAVGCTRAHASVSEPLWRLPLPERFDNDVPQGHVNGATPLHADPHLQSGGLLRGLCPFRPKWGCGEMWDDSPQAPLSSLGFGEGAGAKQSPEEGKQEGGFAPC